MVMTKARRQQHEHWVMFLSGKSEDRLQNVRKEAMKLQNKGEATMVVDGRQGNVQVVGAVACELLGSKLNETYKALIHTAVAKEDYPEVKRLEREWERKSKSLLRPFTEPVEAEGEE